MAKSKLKLELIANKTSRRSTFKKRKRGILKKLTELVTLCDVKACAVIAYNQNDQNPEAWPSKERVKELYSKLVEFPEDERYRNMYDQTTYTWERIRKEYEKMKKLHDENREFKLREVMFDLLQGKTTMDNYYYDANVLKDLSSCIERYVNELSHRIQSLKVRGESFSFLPLDVAAANASHPAVGDVNPVAVSDVGVVTTPLDSFYHIPPYENMNTNVTQQAPETFNDHIQYQNMNQQELAHYQVPTDFSDHAQYQNMNQQELAHYQVPTAFSDHAQYQNVNQQELTHYQVPTDFSDHAQYQNVNHQDQFQYQDLANVYDQNQHSFYGSTQDMSSDLNHNLRESSNDQYPNQWMTQPQQMSYVEELANVPSMDDNYYNYHQLPTTSHMPSMTTTSTVDVSAPTTNNKPWPTRFGLD